MSDKLQQINISYVSAQDRLLLRANTGEKNEFRIWLTRRYSALLLNVLASQINKAGGLQKVSSQEETLSQLKQGAFDKEYESDSALKFPLGEDGILGFTINVNNNDDGGMTLRLLPKEGIGLTLNLNPSMVYMIINLLEQAVMSADWNLQIPFQQKDSIH